VRRGETVVGSSLIGQAFASDRYFHGRPSAAGANGYDAAASSGSNLGPTSKAFLERVRSDVAALGLKPGVVVPADIITASGSGLDPHISPAAAALQVTRVARARNLPVERVRALEQASTSGRLLGIIGEPTVNVLELNLALDAIKS
jgi:K+-transporting ATPase ATPase C chain